MVFSPNLLIQVCVMMYSLLVMCTLFFGCVERKLNIPLNTNKFFTHTVSLRALCPPPLVPAAVWLIIMLCLAGCPAGGL